MNYVKLMSNDGQQMEFISDFRPLHCSSQPVSQAVRLGVRKMLPAVYYDRPNSWNCRQEWIGRRRMLSQNYTILLSLVVHTPPLEPSVVGFRWVDQVQSIGASRLLRP